MSEKGIETNPKKIQVIWDWPHPTKITETHSFLGLYNSYQKFIKDYVKITQPLYKLTSGENSKWKNNEVEWDQDCEIAFLLLKRLCTEAPILMYADYTKPFKVHTDASKEGLGAILYQTKDDGTDRVIAYASCSLKKSEQKYHSSKLEFLALKWAITNQFHEYLHSGTFEAHFNNNPLTYVLTTAKLDATGQRWVTSLANYNFTITYHCGKHNIDVNTLSRVPWSVGTTDQPLLIKSALIRGTQGESSILMIPPDLRVLSKITQAQERPQLTPDEWKQAQADDPDIGPMVEFYKPNNYKSTRQGKMILQK